MRSPLNDDLPRDHLRSSQSIFVSPHEQSDLRRVAPMALACGEQRMIPRQARLVARYVECW